MSDNRIEDEARACYLSLGNEDLDEDVVYIAGYVTGHAAGAAELDAARARIEELEAEIERLHVHQVIRAGGAEPITDADLETSDIAPRVRSTGRAHLLRED